MSIFLVPVIICACYLVMISLCICDRMTPKTSHFTRITVALVGGIGAWALFKTVMTGWNDSVVEVIQAVMVILVAAIMASMPRIKVCQHEKVADGNRKPVRSGK